MNKYEAIQEESNQKVAFEGDLKFTDVALSLMRTMFANGPGDRRSIPGRVIPKTQKMVLDSSLLNTQLYKVLIKV